MVTVIGMGTFDEVYRQHLAAVFRYAVRVVGRRDVAEELTSEAFVALWRTFDTIDASRLPGWLLTFVRNRATDYWRRASVEQSYLAALDRSPVAQSGNAEFKEWLDAAPSLKPVHRAVLILRYVHGLERAEIATRLNLTETQVKGHLQYAHSLLRRELNEVE
jgi:RNA polymerase sigma-70 factor, ECF subfamily